MLRMGSRRLPAVYFVSFKLFTRLDLPLTVSLSLSLILSTHKRAGIEWVCIVTIWPKHKYRCGQNERLARTYYSKAKTQLPAIAISTWGRTFPFSKASLVRIIIVVPRLIISIHMRGASV